jgi:hypothetical protein
MIQVDLLTNLNNYKAFAGISGTDQDAQINAMIPMASQAITNSCNRQFFLATNQCNPITRYFSGAGDVYLPLTPVPIQSITSIYVDFYGTWNPANFSSGGQLLPADQYALAMDGDDGTYSQSGIVYRRLGWWWDKYQHEGNDLSNYLTYGKGNIQVTFTAGYTYLPSDLQFACNLVVSRMINASSQGYGFRSEMYENYRYELNTGNTTSPNYGFLGGDVGVILAKYRLFVLPQGL